MINGQKLSNAHDAATYYEETDDYYRESESGGAPSQWRGKVAEQLGLTGEVNHEDFENMLAGVTPKGHKFGYPQWQTNKNGERELTRRPGDDFVLSAPKSVSVMAGVANDDRAKQAHDRAAAKAIDQLEQYIEGRERHGNKIDRYKTGKAAIATFRHETSRAQESNLHTHAVVLNVTEISGRLRANDPSTLYKNQKYLSQLYQFELANELKYEGFQVETRELRDGTRTVEIVGVPEQALKDHSSRREAIEAALKDQGIDPETATREQRQTATLNTRASKEATNHDELRNAWQADAEEGDYYDDLINISQKAAERREGRTAQSNDENAITGSQTSAETADKAVRHAIEHSQERDSRFTHQTLKKEAMRYAMGQTNDASTSAGAVERAIAQKASDGVLLRREVVDHGHEVAGYTTSQGIKTERAFLNIERQGRGAETALMSNDEAAQRVADAESDSPYNWTPAQRETTKQALTNNDRIFGVQGYAGTAKTTTVMKTYADVAKEQGFQLRGLAQQSRVASDIEDKVGIESQTVAGFILKNRGQETPQNEIWMVDEASQLSANDMRDLLRLAEEGNNKVMLVGDRQQLGSVEAGDAYSQLQDAGMTTAVLDSIVRQNDQGTREAVEHSIEGDARSALNAIEYNGEVIEIGPVSGKDSDQSDQDSENTAEHESSPDDPSGEQQDEEDQGRTQQQAEQDRREQMANEYLALTPEQRDQTLLIEPSREGRAAINEKLRESLKEEGTLQGDDAKVTSLERADLTNTQKQDNSAYDVGQTIRFTKERKRDGIEKGDYQVTGREDDGRLSIENKETGDQHALDMSKVSPKNTRVYESRDIGLAEGDKIQITENDKERDLQNGDKATVTDVDSENETARIQMNNGRELDIDLNDEQNMRHDYATTVHGSQGATSDRVIAHLESWRENLVDQKSTYVALSRAKESVSVITDDRESLIDNIQERTGDVERSIDRGYERDRDDERRDDRRDERRDDDRRETDSSDYTDQVMSDISDRIDSLNRSADVAEAAQRRADERAKQRESEREREPERRDSEIKTRDERRDDRDEIANAADDLERARQDTAAEDRARDDEQNQQTERDYGRDAVTESIDGRDTQRQEPARNDERRDDRRYDRDDYDSYRDTDGNAQRPDEEMDKAAESLSKWVEEQEQTETQEIKSDESTERLDNEEHEVEQAQVEQADLTQDEQEQQSAPQAETQQQQEQDQSESEQQESSGWGEQEQNLKPLQQDEQDEDEDEAGLSL